MKKIKIKRIRRIERIRRLGWWQRQRVDWLLSGIDLNREKRKLTRRLIFYNTKDCVVAAADAAPTTTSTTYSAARCQVEVYYCRFDEQTRRRKSQRRRRDDIFFSYSHKSLLSSNLFYLTQRIWLIKHISRRNQTELNRWQRREKKKQNKRKRKTKPKFFLRTTHSIKILLQQQKKEQNKINESKRKINDEWLLKLYSLFYSLLFTYRCCCCCFIFGCKVVERIRVEISQKQDDDHDDDEENFVVVVLVVDRSIDSIRSNWWLNWRFKEKEKKSN